MHTFLAEAAHYLDIAQMLDLESQHGDPDHPKYLIKMFFVSLQRYPKNFIKIRS